MKSLQDELISVISEDNLCIAKEFETSLDTTIFRNLYYKPSHKYKSAQIEVVGQREYSAILEKKYYKNINMLLIN